MVKVTHTIVLKSLDKLGDSILAYLTSIHQQSYKKFGLIKNNIDSWITWYCNFLFTFMSKKKIKKVSSG